MQTGGSGAEYATSIALSGSSIYIAGYFERTTTLAGTTLASAGENDLFLAKFIDQGSTVANGWAVRGGGRNADGATGVAVSGANVYLAAYCGIGATVAGTALAVVGANTGMLLTTDLVVAKYIDQGSTVADGWALRGGGLTNDYAYGIAADGPNVYVTGAFSGAAVTLAGTTLTSTGPGPDMFLAKFIDQGSIPADGWAVQGGGDNADEGRGIAVVGASVYVTGKYSGSTGGRFAGTTLPSLGLPYSTDIFVAKYTDTGTSAANGWAVHGGGTGEDVGNALAVSGSAVYVTGTFANTTGATLAGAPLADPSTAGWSMFNAFVARYTDTGPAATGDWATGTSSGGYDTGYSLAVRGATLYSALLAGDRFKAGPYPAPAQMGVLGQQDAATGTWQHLVWPLTNVRRSPVMASATDASGNVYVAGFFTRNLQFGTTQLVGTDRFNLYLAKWSPATGTWAWAVQGGSDHERDYVSGIAIDGNAVYLAGTFGGSFATFGDTTIAAAGSVAGFLVKYEASGSTVRARWARSFSNAPVTGLAVQGRAVYLAGYFGAGGTKVAGTALTSAGGTDVFVAKYLDAGPQASNGWALRDGGPADDAALGLALEGANLYLTGTFQSNAAATLTGTALGGAGGRDMFVAKYVDQGPTVGNGWVTTGGGTDDDDGRALAVYNHTVYVVGEFRGGAGAQLASATLPNAGYSDAYLAQYHDNGTTMTPGWATSLGSRWDDTFEAVAVRGASVYVAGRAGNRAVVADTAVSGSGFLIKYLDNGAAATAAWVTQGYNIRGSALALTGASVYMSGAAHENPRVGPFSIANPLNPADPNEINYLARLDDYAPGLLTATVTGTGTTVTLTGTNLVGATSVTFASPTGPIVVSTGLMVNAAGTQLTLPLPAGATTGGLVSVVTPTGLSNSVALTLATSPAPGPTAPLLVLPNPAHGTATVLLPALSGAATLQLFDVLGRSVRAETLPASTTATEYPFDLAGLAPGLYLVRLVAGAATATQRLVVE